MADYENDETLTPEESIQDALEFFAFVTETETDQDKQEQEDLSFQRASGAWPDDIKSQFGPVKQGTTPGYVGPNLPARPMISIASLDEPIALVSAQQRSAHLGVRIHPLSEDASDETAEILQGLYRQIERDSRAYIARGWAYDRCLWAGRGGYRIDKVYDQYGGHPLDQKLLIKRILDQSTIKRDPYAQEPDWSDGTRLMIAVPMSWKSYKRKWPKSRVSGWDDQTFDTNATHSNGWLDVGTGENRTIRVCEDWRVEVTEKKKVLLEDGSMEFEDDADASRVRTGKDARSVTVTERRVFWRIINAFEELQPEQEWDGEYIPIPTVIGRELQPTKGKRGWIGMVTNAKDAVRLTNYAASNAVRMAALEPRAPWIGRRGTFDNSKDMWQQSNTRDFPYLEYEPKADDGTPNPEPKRVQVDVSRLGPSMQLLSMGRDFVQTATATYDPALGKQPTAHRSGRAIEALQDQSISSNSPYLDNLANVSMTYEAMVILDLMPKIYDRPGRIARILDKQDVSSWVMLNHPFVSGPNGRPIALPYDTDEEKAAADAFVNDPQHPAKHYDLTKGRYGVEVSIGKSYKDQRDEGLGEMGMILQADPNLMQIVGPEYFKHKGEPWADAVAELLRKNRDHTMPWLASDPQQVDPMRVQAENAQLKQQLQQAAQVIQTKQVEQQGKLQIATLQEGAESARAAKDRETKLAVAELSARVDRLTLFLEERARLGDNAHDAAMASGDHQAALQQMGAQQAHDALMAGGDHQAELQQADQAHGQALQQGNQAVAGQLAVQAAAPQPQNGEGG